MNLTLHGLEFHDCDPPKALPHATLDAQVPQRVPMGAIRPPSDRQDDVR